MSQYIRKFEPGGSVANPENAATQTTTPVAEDTTTESVVFRTSQGEYDADKLSKIYELNIPQFAEYLGLKRGSKKYNLFIQEAANILSGIRNGTLSRGDGMIYSGPGLSDDNKMLRYGLGLLDKILLNYPTKQKQAEKTKEKYSFGNLKKYFWNRYYGGNEDADLQSWLDRDKPNEEGVRANTNRANELANMLSDYADNIEDGQYDFSGSAFKDEIEYRRKLKEAAESLRDGTWDNNDAAKLDAIGFSRTLRELLLGDGTMYDSSGKKKEEDPNSYEALLKKKREELQADVKAGIITPQEAKLALEEWKEDYKDLKYGDLIWDNNYQKWANEHWTWTGDTFEVENHYNPNNISEEQMKELVGVKNPDNPSKNIPGLLEQNPLLLQQLSDVLDKIAAGNRIDDSVWNRKYGSTQISFASIFRAWFENQLSSPEAATRINNSDLYYLNGTFDFEKGTALLYDVKKHCFIRVHVDDTKTPFLYKKYKDEYKKQNPRRRSSSSSAPKRWQKQGGKLEALKALHLLRNGGAIRKGLLGFDSSSLSKNLKDIADETYNSNILAEAKARGISVEATKEAHQALDWSKPYNWLRGVSTLADAASVGLSAAGVTSWAAPVAGYVGDLLNFGADAWDPGVSKADMWTNAGINFGLSSASIIPFAGATGKLAKLGKAGKKVLNAAKTAGMVYGAYNTAQALPAAYNALSGDGDMSNDDWRTVTGATSGLLTTGLGVLRGLTQAHYRHKYKSQGSVIEVSDINGRKYTVSEAQQKAMQKAFDDASKAKGATSESVNRAVVNAWANEGGVLRQQAGKALWDNSLEGNWLTRSEAPTSELTINTRTSDGTQRQVKLSVEDLNKLRNDYNNAKNSVTEELVMREIGEAPTRHFDELSDAQKAAFNTKKAELQTTKINEKLKSSFESLDATKEIDGFVDEPKFIPDGWSARTGFMGGTLDTITRNKLNGLSFEESAIENSPFDVRTAIGRQNVLTRVNSNEGFIGRNNRLRYIGGSKDPLIEALENRLVGTYGDSFAHLIDSPEFGRLVHAEGLRLNKKMGYKDLLILANQLLDSYNDGSRFFRLGISYSDEPSIIEYYSKKLNPSYESGVSDPLSKGLAAMLFEEDYLKQNKTPSLLLADILVNDKLKSILIKDGSTKIDDSMFLTATNSSKQDFILKKAKEYYGNIDGFSDEQYINRYITEQPNRVKTELKKEYTSQKTKSERLNWQNNEGLLYIEEARNSGRTNLTEAQIDQMRSLIKQNNDMFSSFSESTTRTLTPEERTFLKSKIDERNIEIAKDPSKTAYSDTDLEYLLSTERYKNASLKYIDNLGLDSTWKTKLSDFLDQKKLEYERLDLSQDEITNRLSADRINKADELVNAQNIAEANAELYSNLIFNNRVKLFNLDKAKYGRFANTKEMAKEWNDVIDMVAERNKSMLPNVAGQDLLPKFKGFLKGEISKGRKIDDILNDFNTKTNVDKIGLLTLADENTVFLHKYVPTTIPPGKTRSGASYTWKSPSSGLPTGARPTIDKTIKSNITKLFNGSPVSDNQIQKIAEAYGFGTAVDPARFKSFLLNSKEIKKYITVNSTGKSITTKLVNSKNIDKIADYLNRAKLLDMFHSGGTLNKLKSLRNVNFTSDSIDSSLILSEKQGGILKASKGDLIVENPSDWEWYTKLYKLQLLGNVNLRDRNQHSTNALNANLHNINFDLGLAAAKNDSYTSNSDIVGLDLQNYYSSTYGEDDIDSYINHYNSDAAKIRGFWGVGADGSLSDTHYNANTDTGDNIAEHNRLFRKMFGNRSLATSPEGQNYNIGYQDNIDNIMGTSTWMRRMDRYRTEFEDDTFEGKLSRIHPIKLKDGTIAYVYKKANGDIAKLENPEQYFQLTPTDKETPTLPAGEIVGTNIGIYGDGTATGERPSQNIQAWFQKSLDKIDKDKLKSNALLLGRVITLNRVNNKNLLDTLKMRAPLLSPIDKHRYVYGDYSALLLSLNLAAQLLSQAGRARTSDASLNMQYQLQATNQANQYQQKGEEAYNKLLRSTADGLWAIDDKVYDYNHRIKDQNNASLIDTENKKIKAITATRTANITNWDNYLKALELDVKNNIEIKRGYQKYYDDLMDQFDLAVAKQNNPEYQKLYNDYITAYRSGDKDAYDKAYSALLAYENSPASIIAQAEAYNGYARKHGLKVANLRALRGNSNDPFAGYQPSGITEAKDGGKIDDSETKRTNKQNTRLVKQIESSIKNLQKTLDRLSQDELYAIKRFLK